MPNPGITYTNPSDALYICGEKGVGVHPHPKPPLHNLLFIVVIPLVTQIALILRQIDYVA